MSDSAETGPLQPDIVSAAAELPDSEGQPVVADPAQLIRIGTMVQALRDEVRSLTLDEPARQRLSGIFDRALRAVNEVLSDELQAELAEFHLPFGDGLPTADELRVAQAQLAGWLEGLFRGIQAAVFSQQMAAQQQLQELRRPQLQRGQGPAGQYL